MLVYERLFHGSLDRLLFGRSDGPPIDWNARTKIALCAAQGLTFLHEEGPFQALANLSEETLERGLITPKSNVWSFGIVLLELLTAEEFRQSASKGRNLVKWSRPF
ncbi:hypothetical protein HAX54_020852 [Datura stramonium]|uniref:Protein kinase domain-containing protein n=1 Tax=Datura stramonium TaxID=4076 RepID=A0ABS8USV6_DATST|nr:hypothetical protein [Datura stramonium]